jgi:hypothetical protein
MSMISFVDVRNLGLTFSSAFSLDGYHYLLLEAS